MVQHENHEDGKRKELVFLPFLRVLPALCGEKGLSLWSAGINGSHPAKRPQRAIPSWLVEIGQWLAVYYKTRSA